MSTPQRQRVRKHRSAPAEAPPPESPAQTPLAETPEETPNNNTNPETVLSEILMRVNDIRLNLGIPKMKLEKRFRDFTPELIKGAIPDSPSSVFLTWLSFVEAWDYSKTSEEIITKWMADPSRRPVLLAPGDKIWLDIGDKDGTDVVIFIVCSLFH